MQVEALEKSLSFSENSQKMSDLETELEIASSELTRLQKALEDMEQWKEQLVKESKQAHTDMPRVCSSNKRDSETPETQ